MNDLNKYVVVQTVLVVRIAFAEAFGKDFGKRVTGKMVIVLKCFGFYFVFDTDFIVDFINGRRNRISHMVEKCSC